MRDFFPSGAAKSVPCIAMEINTKMWTRCRALFCGTEGVEFGVQGYPEAGEGALRACARGERRTPEIGIRVAPLRCRWGLVETRGPAGEGAQLVKGRESAQWAPSGAGTPPHPCHWLDSRLGFSGG